MKKRNSGIKVSAGVKTGALWNNHNRVVLR